jgi:parallel beta-helix repeat protein
VWLNNTTDLPETESWTTNRHHRVQGCVAREQGGYGFYVVRGYACSLLGNDSGGCSSDGFKTTRRNRLLRIEANHSEGNGRDGYDFYDGLLESVVCGNVSRDNSLFGYEVKGTLGGDDIGNDDYVVRDSIISSNIASGNGGTGFAVVSIRNTVFVGNLAVSNGHSANPALLTHDGFTFTNLQGVDVTGCVATKNVEHGFHAQSTARALFSGCVAVDNSYADGTTQNGSFDGFHVDSTSTAQIVGGRAFNGTVVGHKGGQRYAIDFGGATNSLVDGFDASGNVTGAVNGRTGNLVTDYINHTATRLGAENDTSDALALTPRQRLKSKTLTANSATPSVADANKAATANTAATTITNFASGVDGQILFFRAGDALTTVQHGTNIFLKGGASKTFALNETAVFAYDGTAWYQYA